MQNREAENPKKSRYNKTIMQMVKSLKSSVWFCMLLILPVSLFAQKDITQFLGIPIDGYKPEMIQKLKAKGFTNSPYAEDILVGELSM